MISLFHDIEPVVSFVFLRRTSAPCRAGSIEYTRGVYELLCHRFEQIDLAGQRPEFTADWDEMEGRMGRNLQRRHARHEKGDPTSLFLVAQVL